MTVKQVLALAKSYTDTSVEGAGAIKGKNCEIQSIEPITGGNRVTFAWYNGSDVLVTDTLDVMDGEDGAKGDKGDKGDTGATGATGNGIASIEKTSTVGNVDTYTITMTDGTTATFTVTNGGVNVVANPEGTASDSLTKIEIGETIYSVSGGSGGASSYTELEDKPTMNGYTIIGDMVSADLGLASASDIPDSLDDLSDDANHRTVTDTEKTTWNGKADVSAIPTKTTDLTNDSGFITNTVNNLANYYTKSQTYTQTEVDSLIAAAKNGRFIYVTTLPTTDIDTKAIYLVPSSDPEAGNVKDEYINTDGTSSGWELIGSTAIDLSGYVQKSQTAGLLKNDGTVNTTIEGAVTANTSAISTIKDGANIDSFGDVETALAGKMPNYGIGTGLYVDSDTNQLRADAVTLAIKDSPKLITSGAVFSGLSPKYGTADQDETDLDGQDKFPFYDNSASAKRHTTFGNIKAKLKEYFDSLYVAAVAGKGLSTNDYNNTAKGIVDNIQDNVIANTKLIKDTVGWSGKNKLKNTGVTSTIHNVTFTVNSDKSVTINGTASATIFFRIGQIQDKGSQILNGVTGGSFNTYGLTVRTADDQHPSFSEVNNYDGDTLFTVPSDYSNALYVNIRVPSGATVNNVTVYPMIRDDDILDPTFEPYFGSTAFPRSEQAVLGAKNWLNIPKGTYTQYDVTIVVDDTGITLNGTCNATSGTKVNVSNLPISINAKVADYKGVDVANNMSDDCYIWMSSPFSGGNINGKSWTVSTAAKVTGALSIKGGVTYTNFKIQPMIVLASDSDLSTYAPYAMTNEQLTYAVTKKTIQYASKSDAIATLNKAYIKKVGSVCQCVIDFVVGSANINAWTNLVTFSENTGISPGSNQIIAIRDVTDTTKSSIVGAVINSGNLQIGSALTAEHRYMASFTYIAES